MQDRPVSNTNPQAETNSPRSRKQLLTEVTGEIAIEAFRIGAIAGIVSPLLYIPDIAMQRFHTPTTTSKSLNFSALGRSAHTGFTLGAARLFALGLIPSYKQTCTKYLFTGQRTKLLDEKPDSVTEAESLKRPSIPFAGFVTLGISFADTFFTHPHANQKAWEIHAAFQQMAINRGVPGASPFPVPAPMTYKQWLTAFSAGFGVRLSRNFILVGGLVFTPFLEDRIKGLTTNPTYRTYLSATLIGGVTGFISNGFDAIYKIKVTQINPVNFKTPSTYNIILQNGWKVLGRGAIPSMIYTQVAYNAVFFAESAVSRFMPTFVEKASQTLTNLAQCMSETEAFPLLLKKRGLQNPLSEARGAMQTNVASTPETLPNPPSAPLKNTSNWRGLPFWTRKKACPREEPKIVETSQAAPKPSIPTSGRTG